MKMDSKLVAILLACVAFVSYSLVVFGSGVIFGDEGYYASNGRWIAQNGLWPSYEPMQKTDVYMVPFQKQPLFLFLNSAAWLLGGELGIKMMLPVISALAGLSIFLFARERFGAVAALAAMSAFFLSLGVITYAVLDYVEVFMVMLFILAMHFALKDKPDKIDIMMAGVFTGLAVLTDVTGLFLVPLLAFTILWKSRVSGMKPLVYMLVVALVVVSPFLLRNLYFFGGFCMPGPGILGACTLNVPPLDTGNVQLSAASTGGTSVPVLSMGFASYFDFAVGFPVFLLLLFGVAALLYRKDLWHILVPWFGLFVILVLQQSLFGGRAEDIPRYTLFGYPAVALMAGLFLSEAHDFAKKYNRVLPVLLVALLLLFAVPEALQKLGTMKGVKTFPDSFLNACDWVRANTPEDARLFTPYQHAMSWECDRKGYAGGEVPDVPLILTSNNDTAYQHLKAHGTDYVFVPDFVVSNVPYSGTISVAFLNYMDSSPHFKLVFDNRKVYGEGNGVRIYQVL